MTEAEIIMKLASLATTVKTTGEGIAELIALITKRVEVKAEDGAEISITVIEGE